MNEVATLDRCLTSLANQSLRDVAIIIQDNFSDDGSDKVLAFFENSFSNIFVSTRLTRVDSWQNWDEVLRKAEEFFEFEYLFWLGGDDYLAESDFLQNLYEKGVRDNLNVVTPTIKIIEGKNGNFKKYIEIQLQSKYKLFRLLKYANNWDNVNVLHSLIRKPLYREIISKADDSHTRYIANDWWFGANIISKNQVESMKYVHFCKSQWGARRYPWIESKSVERTDSSTNDRLMMFSRHLFQDFSILRNHLLRPHPLRDSLTAYEISIILAFYFIRTLFRPLVIFGKWFCSKFISYLRKPFTSSPTVN